MAFLDNVPILKKIMDFAYTLLLVILLSVIVGLILAVPIMLLWNFVFGSVFKINFLQAWALNVLVGILFGKASSYKK